MSATAQTDRAGESPLAILVCSKLVTERIDHDPLSKELRDRLPAVRVEVVQRLSDNPLAAVRALRAIHARRALLAVCETDADEGDLHAVARLSNIDVYGVAAARVSPAAGPAAAARTIAAAARRLALAPVGEPAKLELASGRLTRRSLLRLAPVFTAKPVAVVDTSRCVGLAWCGLCHGSCDAGAIENLDGKASVRTSACGSCGDCLGVCPVNAIHIAGTTTEQIEAQLTTLLEEPPGEIALLCARARRSARQTTQLDGWAIVELPGLALVSPGWVLQLLAHGVDAIRLVPCQGDCCAAWRDGGPTHDLCLRNLPEAIASRITVEARPDSRPDVRRDRRPMRAVPADLPLVLEEPAATVSALEALGTPVRTTHPAAPLGLIEIEDGCTLCAACTISCPTDALRTTTGNEIATLTFRPELCTGCGLCIAACPEHVLSLRRAVDTERLAAGPAELASASLGRCPRCNEPLPPRPTLDRVRDVLVGRGASVSNLQPDLCLACAAGGQPLAQRDGLRARR